MSHTLAAYLHTQKSDRSALKGGNRQPKNTDVRRAAYPGRHARNRLERTPAARKNREMRQVIAMDPRGRVFSLISPQI